MEKLTINKEVAAMDRLTHEIWKACYHGEQFSLTRLIKEHGIYNKSFIDFLQDCRIIENTGGIGVHAKWKWTSVASWKSLQAARTFPAEVLHNWEIYRTGNPRDLRDFSKVKEQETNYDDRILKLLEENSNIIKRSIRITGDYMNLSASVLQDLKSGNYVVEERYLFGLIKIKSRIIYKPRK